MTARKPPPDTPAEAEFRAYAREWAGYVLAPERTDDAALDTAIMAGADLAGFATALKLATMRRHRMIAGYHRHARNLYIIGLCAAAEGVGIARAKARRIVGDEFGLEPPTIRKIDRVRLSSAKGDPSDGG